MTNLELHNFPHPPPPPSYEQCMAPMLQPILIPRAADYTATPLAMAALLALDDEED